MADKIEKPRYTTVGLPPGFPKPVLNVTHANGESESLPISRKVAEVLIATGFAYEG